MRSDCEWFRPEDSLDHPGVVEALVAEAEQGYDGRLAAEFVSRPPDEEIDPLRRIVFRVAAEVRDVAQKRADEEELPLGELAAKALREYIDCPAAVRETSGDS